jgi:glycerol-3-phosphate dehydrogenase (NAD(P)+)
MNRSVSPAPGARERDEADALVVGGGSFGTTLATLLAERGWRPLLLVRRQEQADEINDEHRNTRYFPDLALDPNIFATTDPERAVRGAPVIMMAVPSRSFREVARRLGDFVEGDQVLVHCTKGLELETFSRMSEILRDETCALKIGVISGPTLAAEIMAGHPSGAAAVSHYLEVVRKVQDLFRGGRLRVYTGGDVTGTELGAAFKNIVAIAAGASDGLGFGSMTKALVMTRGLGEMIRFGVANGAEAATFAGLAGAGDMVVNCISPLSRNYRVGFGLGRGEKLDDVLAGLDRTAEGVPTAAAVHSQTLELGLELPIVREVHAVLYEGRPARDAVENLMSHPVGEELDYFLEREE